MEDVQTIFFFDACKQHLGEAVFNACATARIIPIVVPAKTTWLLQPLDTHCFASYKVSLMREYQAARIRSPDGVVGVGELLSSIYVATIVVLEGRDWSEAFARNGYGASQDSVSSRVLCQLGLEAPAMVPSTKPTAEQLKLCFPRRVRIPVDAIWRRGPIVRAKPAAAAAGSRRARRVLPFAKARPAAAATSASRSASSWDASPSACSHAGAAAVQPPMLPMGTESASASGSGPRYMTRFQKRTRRAAEDSAPIS